MDTYLKECNWQRTKRGLSGGLRITLSDEGFQIHDPKGKEISVPWSEINCINAYQVDLFTMDMICVEIFWSDGLRLEINEYMEGYQAVMEFLRNTFIGFDRDWYEKVSYPPLKPNFREVWKRS